jgi:Ni/Fe-hydrogenase 1 B-type cytochrome subunit
MLELRYVWEWPVRITHWINFICILMLSFTGLCIGAPFFEPSPINPYSMGWIRLLHFCFGYLFALSVLVRLIWMFFGNSHSCWKAFVPLLTRRGQKSAYKAFKYYAFLSARTPYGTGHNGLAATTYAGVFILFLVEIVTGLALYGQYAPGGFWNTLTAPLLALVSNQYLRLIHHSILWLLAAFTIIHVYLSWMLDRKMRNGLVSSIFSGYKCIDPERSVD